MCNSDTLAEIGRLWKLWLGASNFNTKQAKRFKEKFQDGIKNVRKQYGDREVMTSLPSAGLLAPVSIFAVPEQFRHFWMAGFTDDGPPDVNPANNPNPTFVFCSFGDEFAVECGTDPIAGFHLTEALASSGPDLFDQTALVITKVLRAACQQFNTWCKAVVRRVQYTNASSASLMGRMYAGDGLMLRQALHSVNRPSVADAPIFMAP